MHPINYNGFIETCLVRGKLFMLRDTSKGFDHDNRVYLREFPAYISQRENYHNELSTLKVIQSIFPLRCYDPSKTVFEMIHSEENALLTENSTTSFHIPYLRPEILSHDPRVMLSIYRPQTHMNVLPDYSQEQAMGEAFTDGLMGFSAGTSAGATIYTSTPSSSQISMTPSTSSSNQQTQDAMDESEPQDDFTNTADSYDPDPGYFHAPGPYFLSVRERRKKETEDPYVWVQYDTETVTGCQHYWSGAFIVCPNCNEIFPCRLCHDDAVASHTLDRYRIREMFCLTCRQIGRIGPQCTHCGTVVSSTFCDRCNTLCLMGPEMRPTYHCERCNLCHVGIRELAQYCEGCHACISKANYKTHICDRSSMCPVCMVPFSENVMPEIALPCNPTHKMHRRCFRDMLMNQNIICPLDHKTILDKYRHGIMRCDHLKRYTETQLSLSPDEPAKVNVYMCHDCRHVSADFYIYFLGPICHFCYSGNSKILYTLSVPVEELIGSTSVGTSTSMSMASLEHINLACVEKCTTEEYDKVRRHITTYRNLYPDIVPAIIFISSDVVGSTSNIIQILMSLIGTHNSSR